MDTPEEKLSEVLEDKTQTKKEMQELLENVISLRNRQIKTTEELVISCYLKFGQLWDIKKDSEIFKILVKNADKLGLDIMEVHRRLRKFGTIFKY